MTLSQPKVKPGHGRRYGPHQRPGWKPRPGGYRPRPTYRAGFRSGENPALPELNRLDKQLKAEGLPLAASPAEAVAGKPLRSSYGEFYEQLCDPANLMEGWRLLRKGRTVAARRFNGTADRVSMELFERHLERNLNRLRYELRSGRYRPGPINQFRLPKPGGGYRSLAVLTVKDRVVQRAALNLIEPLFEPHFLACSYAFRPDRGVGDALEAVRRYQAEGLNWVVDADIAGFFDNIDRNHLLALLAEKINDRPMLKVLSRWLAATPPVLPEPEMVRTPHRPGQSEAELEEVAEEARAEAENELAPLDQPKRLARLTRAVVEGGLDWGIEQLEGKPTAASTYGYGSAYSPYYRAGSRYRNWEDDDEDDTGSYGYKTGGRGGEATQKEDLGRLKKEGLLLTMTAASKLVKHGLLPAKLGLAGAALGTAGTLGALAWRYRHLYLKRSGQDEAEEGFDRAEPGQEFVRFVPMEQRGIAQGSVLSPFYSNVYLHHFDCELSARGFRLVRFADDLVIVCGNEREAYTALSEAEKILGQLGLTFKPSKTRVCRLEKGFQFLGAELNEQGQWVGWQFERAKAGVGADTPKGGSWLEQARTGWLKQTTRFKPGVVQRGRGGKPTNKKTPGSPIGE